jgi:deoxyribose-phosphate aldolase
MSGVIKADDLARRLELELLEPAVTRSDVEHACALARKHRLYGLCVPGSRVELAHSLLEDTDLKITGLVAFPRGDADADAKRYETEVAVDQGAHEIETVINLGQVNDGERKLLLRELRDLVEAADERPVKLVIEAGALEPDDLLWLCELVLDSGVRAVCTGTGRFGPPTVNQVAQLRTALSEKFIIKAAGGILSAADVRALVEAGAVRLGISDATILSSATEL